MYYLYVIENKITDVIYFGMTNRPKQRLTSHKAEAKRGSSTYLHNAMRKYGVDSFEMRVIDSFETREKCCEAEVDIIDLAKQMNIKTYNIHLGGSGGFDIRLKGEEATEEWKAKLREKRKGRKPALGMKHTEETKRICGEANNRKEKRYPELEANWIDSFALANKQYGISKTHYYRLRKARALRNEQS
jgi:group I intron endonuclease